MRRKKSLQKHLMLILLLALIIFLVSCKSAQITTAEIESVLAAISPPLPAKPEHEPVRFEDRDGGLWMSYNDYRALERNIIELRKYAAKLEIILWFYRKEF